MNKKLLFFLLFTLAFIVIAMSILAVWSQSKIAIQNQQKALPAPTLQYKQPNNVTFTFETPPTLPTTLPAFSYQRLNQSDAETLADVAAKTLGFTATPTATLRGNVYTKRWVSQSASLVASVIDESITFLYRQSLPPVTTSNPSADLAVRQFVSLFNKQPIPITLSTPLTGSFDGVLLNEPNPALPIRGYALQYKQNDYSTAVGQMNISAGVVILDANNVIRSATIRPALLATQPAGSISILSLEQILTSLSEKRGTIIKSSTDGSPELGSDPSFSEFSITSTTLFYAPNKDLLVPAFLLSGTGKTPNGDTQNASFFLWAFPAGQ